jgi:DNA-binding PucR family transcriptional regulator
MVGNAEDGSAVALLAGRGHADPVDELRTALRRLEPALGPSRLTVGVSLPTGAGALAGAVAQARHAMGLARMRSGTVEVVSDAEVTSHVALLATVPDDVRRAFASRILEPVLDYDARNDAGLLVTLAAFLDCGGSWTRVAQRLHLHVNTVRYRIGRVEELTGRDMSRFEDRVDLFLALRSG